MDSKILIPMIRKTMPSLTAQQIIGVRPMTGTGKSIFNVRYEVNSRLKTIEQYLNKKYWPYYHKFDRFMFEEVDRWCYDNFKSSNWRSMSGVHYAFKRKEDYTLFLLRWS
jgi:hypothetical protein